MLVKIIEIHISNKGSDLFTQLSLYMSKSHNKYPEENQLLESPLIPHELVAEILSCLPVKSLIRFKCVCKSWNSLICAPHFVKLHLRRHSTPNANPNVLFIWSTMEAHYGKRNILFFPVKSLLEAPSTITEEPYFLGKLKSRYRIIGSCNGLVCLLGCRRFKFTSKHECHWFSFWNPAMRKKSQKSPKVPIQGSNDQLDASSYGFGYDHISDTYKVVSVSNDIERNHVRVYNMGDDNWRDIGSFPTFVPITGRTNGAHLNGTLNWLICEKPKVDQNGIVMFGVVMSELDSYVILSFNLNNEGFVKFSLQGMPSVFFQAFDYPELGVLGGSLCVSYHYMGTHFVVWQMKKFGDEESWIKLLNICYEDLQPLGLQPQLTPLLPIPPKWFPPTCMLDNGDFLMLGQRFIYNQRDNRFQLLEIPGYFFLDSPHMYYESLVSPCFN
ncbi:F-box/kelch-repeat protein At3g23880-like [Lotus japonicus]|uniref:F-box/kelch-repeat protein At3g23880-like n=1 Tax=Lotus japonicus TaxID=34305 RepID=UPI0025841FDE|nr:F-box/kelch-repeat protein At3g23880-like [Lotus japonicus]